MPSETAADVDTVEFLTNLGDANMSSSVHSKSVLARECAAIQGPRLLRAANEIAELRASVAALTAERDRSQAIAESRQQMVNKLSAEHERQRRIELAATALTDVVAWADRVGGMGSERHDRLNAAATAVRDAIAAKRVVNESLTTENERLRRIGHGVLACFVRLWMVNESSYTPVWGADLGAQLEALRSALSEGGAA